MWEGDGPAGVHKAGREGRHGSPGPGPAMR